MTFSERIQWILDHRTAVDAKGKERPMSANALSDRAGLARSYLRMAMKAEREGKSTRPGADAIDKLAKAGDVSARWLGQGVGPREPYQGTAPEGAANDPESPFPPPASVTRIAYDQVQGLIKRAMDPERGHEIDDAFMVAEALRLGATLDAGDDPAAFTGRLLDTAVKYRGRKPPIQPRDLLSLTLARVATENERLELRMREIDQHGRDWRRENHLTEGERPTHPLLLEAAEEATRPGPKGHRH